MQKSIGKCEGVDASLGHRAIELQINKNETKITFMIVFTTGKDTL